MTDPRAQPESASVSADGPWERAILAFERSWCVESPPQISQAVHHGGSTARAALARELALIDMEFRWQSSAKGNSPSDSLGGRPTWRDYARHVRDLGAVADIPAELVAEEYRVRQLWGDRPTHDRFISAYPRQLPQLPKWLSRIDEELRADAGEVEESLATPVVAAPADPRAPLPWSDYVLERHLGSGGFGKVYRAVQRSLERPVAVKALHKARQQDPQAVEQFIEEARMLARLNHPGIVGVHGLGRYPGGGYFLVLDLIEGEDLQQRIERGRLPIADAAQITIAVAEAIQHAHEHDVLHGDLKPSNVLCGRDGNITVTDFGLGRLLPTSSASFQNIRFRGGTLAYMAPEVARDGTIGRAVDIYGLGAVFNALLTGSPPRTDEHPESIPDGVPRGIHEIVLKCLAPNPADRFPTAADLLRSLQQSTIRQSSIERRRRLQNDD